jgi:hypothetical protein
VSQFYDLTVNRLVRLLGTEPMYTDELNRLGKQLFGNKKYIGTFPVDKAPLNKSGYMIVNTDPSGESGEHWIAIIVDSKHIYVYDSYGRDTKNILPLLVQKAKKKKLKIVESRRDAEQDDSKVYDRHTCGQRSLAWLLVVSELGIKNALKI